MQTNTWFRFYWRDSDGANRCAYQLSLSWHPCMCMHVFISGKTRRIEAVDVLVAKTKLTEAEAAEACSNHKPYSHSEKKMLSFVFS